MGNIRLTSVVLEVFLSVNGEGRLLQVAFRDRDYNPMISIKTCTSDVSPWKKSSRV